MALSFECCDCAVFQSAGQALSQFRQGLVNITGAVGQGIRTRVPTHQCSAKPEYGGPVITRLVPRSRLEEGDFQIASGSRANQNVWSAALSQAKNEVDRLVCANVFGLRWSTRLLAMMECAALSSYLVRQPGKTFPVCRFRERRVRPLCHLMVRQQTWQK